MNGSQLLRALADRAGRPFGVHLQVADRCNHACGHCYQVQGEKGELDLDALRGIIDGCRDRPDAFGTVFAGRFGIEGVLKEELIDLSATPDEDEDTRINLAALAAWVEGYDYQFKFVVSLPGDVLELRDIPKDWQ